MSTIGEVAPGSFDSYEGIRVLIPGLVTFTAGLGTLKTIAPDQATDVVENPFVALVASLILGLFLYFWDLPARAASYSENLPTGYLEAEFPEVKPAELVTFHLLTLNTKMPSNTRNRSLYMGSMYRIGVEMIMALAIASYVVFGAALIPYGPPVASESHWPRWIAGLVLVAVFAFSVVVYQGYERRSADRAREAANKLVRAVWADIWKPYMLLYGVGLLLMCLPNLTVLIDALSLKELRAIVVIGGALCAGVWAYKYIRGFKTDPRTPRVRRAMRAPTAGALFVAPIVVALGLYGPRQESVLPANGTLAAWTAVVSLVTMSIVIRGHERKLHGVYRGQTRWLQENLDEVRSFLSPAAQTPAPSSPRYSSRTKRISRGLWRLLRS